MAGFFGKRALLFLFSKKAAFGLFSVLSVKKFLFLPAWIWIICASGGVSFLLWLSSLEAPVTKRRQAIATTPEVEAQLGAAGVSQLSQEGMRVLPDKHPAAKRLRKIGEKVSHALALLDCDNRRWKDWLRQDWTFKVFDGYDSLAFSTPSGSIWVSQRLLDLVRSDDQLAFIVGHEMGHLLARHAGEAITRNAYWLQVAEMMKEYVGIEASDNIVQLFLQLPFDRQQEHEADLIAMACYNIAAGMELFARLQTEAKEFNTPSWLQHWSSHPSMQDRLDRMKRHFPDILKESPCAYKQDLLEAMAFIASPKALTS